MNIKLLLIGLILPAMLFVRPKSLEEQISEYALEKNFSGTILIQKQDSILFDRSFGLANRQFNIPNNNETVYHIASITKLFTAVAILQLNEEGKIDLHQTINHYLPDYAGEGAKSVTIHH